MKAEVAAALARMEARRRMPEALPINWRGWGQGECISCRSKSAPRIIHVTPHRRAARTGEKIEAWNHPAERWSTTTVTCIDKDVCRARSARAAEVRQRRSGNLVWRCSRFEKATSEGCRWCGEPIIFIEGVGGRYAARARHRGDEVEVGGRDCRREYERSWVYQPHFLIVYRGDPCCVDCGDTGDDWEADHDLALEDGGEHSVVNLVRRCVPCHKAKTKAENRARRERRRVDKAQATT